METTETRGLRGALVSNTVVFSRTRLLSANARRASVKSAVEKEKGKK